MSPPYSIDNTTYYCTYCLWSCPIDADQECPKHGPNGELRVKPPEDPEPLNLLPSY